MLFLFLKILFKVVGIPVKVVNMLHEVNKLFVVIKSKNIRTSRLFNAVNLVNSHIKA